MRFWMVAVGLGLSLIGFGTVRYAFAASSECVRVVGKFGSDPTYYVDSGCAITECDEGDGDCVAINPIGTPWVYCECDESDGNPCVIHARQGWNGPLPPNQQESYVVWCEDEFCTGICDPEWVNGRYTCPCE